MAYGSSEEALKDSSALRIGVHNDIEIESIEGFTTEPNPSGKTFDVIDITFVNPLGSTHKHRVFSPETETDPNKKAKKETAISNLVSYIATKVNGKPCILSGEGITDFESFTKQAIKLIGDYAGSKFQFKLVGQVYNGKPSIGITNYNGWLEPMDSIKKLEISLKESKNNLEYTTFYSTVSTSTKPMVGGGGIPNVGGVGKEKLPF